MKNSSTIPLFQPFSMKNSQKNIDSMKKNHSNHRKNLHSQSKTKEKHESNQSNSIKTIIFNTILILIRLFNQNKKNFKIIQSTSKTGLFTASLYTLYTVLYIYPLSWDAYRDTPYIPIQTSIAHSGRLSGYLYTPYIPIETYTTSWDAYRDTPIYPPSWDAYPDILYSTPKLGRVSGYTPPHPKI